jgi:hypothetical protein
MARLWNAQALSLLIAAVAASAGCGKVVREGGSAVYLVVDQLTAVRGGAGTAGGTGAGTLTSDVITNVTSPAPCSTSAPCPTVFGDGGQVVLRLAVKNVTTAGTPLAPTSNSDVTITRYHVSYRRADGRNTQGVDVPYAFDGATTGTVVVGGTVGLSFVLVRNTAKQEAPLVQLITSPTIITTIADVTFYGEDQVGNAVNVTGSIQIDFGNFGD